MSFFSTPFSFDLSNKPFSSISSKKNVNPSSTIFLAPKGNRRKKNGNSETFLWNEKKISWLFAYNFFLWCPHRRPESLRFRAKLLTPIISSNYYNSCEVRVIIFVKCLNKIIPPKFHHHISVTRMNNSIDLAIKWKICNWVWNNISSRNQRVW